jgi:tripeptide aminopeptidase
MDHGTLIDDIVSIARIPSPTFGEHDRLEWIADRLSSAPGRLHRDDVGNLIWAWGDGRPRVMLTAHVDTVFPLSVPIAIAREGDWLIGPGVGDNAAAIAVAIHVGSRVLAAHELGSGAIAFTVGEEGLGNLRGARHAFERLKPSNVIALEGHGLESVVAVALGSMRARIAITGPGGHAWKDRARSSAIHALVHIAADVLRHGSDLAPVNIGLIQGGLAVNAVAGSAELVVEKRSTDASELSGFIDSLGALTCDDGLRLTVEKLGDRPGGVLPRDSPLLATVLSVRRELGLRPTVEAGSTDANAAIGLGIPALSLGVSYGRDMHTVDERVDSSSLALGAQQVEHVLTAMLS